MKNEAYEIYMNTTQQFLKIGDRVGVFDLVTQEGKVRFYGWGEYRGKVYSPLKGMQSDWIRRFHKGVELIDYESCVMLDSGNKIYSSHGIMLAKDITSDILEHATSIVNVALLETK